MADLDVLIPLPFLEAIEWARTRQVVLPEVYYGQLQGLARAQAFTIAGLTSLDQIQAVSDSLAHVLESGETFRDWQKRVAAGEIPLELGPAQLETIFRNNIQQSYNRGRYEQQAANVGTHPYYMYDAVNDSRTRPSHAAMDGFVAPADDPVWNIWSPACGHRCRCRRVALTERQAARYREQDAERLADPEFRAERDSAKIGGPDKGWGYDIYRDPNAGLKGAVERRLAQCDGGAGARLALPGTAGWCRLPAIKGALDDMQRTLGQWQDEARLLRGAMDPTTYERLADRSRAAAGRLGLSEPQGVILSAYTDRELDAWPLMNELARDLPHTKPLRLSERDLYRAGIMVQIMDAALALLPPVAGTFRRGVASLDMPGDVRSRFLAAHQDKALVRYEAYTSVMDGEPYAGDIQMTLSVSSARNIGAFSIKQEPELILPRHVVLRTDAMRDDAGKDFKTRYLHMSEQDTAVQVPARRYFSTDATAESSALLLAMREEHERRMREGPPPTQAEVDRCERMQVEAGGYIPARFKHLQYLNKPR